jgi:hypothetical protein
MRRPGASATRLRSSLPHYGLRAFQDTFCQGIRPAIAQRDAADGLSSWYGMRDAARRRSQAAPESLIWRRGSLLRMASRKIVAAWRWTGCAWTQIFCVALFGAFLLPAFTRADSLNVHGLWVWKSPTVIETPGGAQALLDFCKSEGINEVYVSISEQSEPAEENEIVHTIDLLHRSNIRVEALLSSTEADEPGKHRETLLRHVQEVVQFNQRHPGKRFDGIHLDVEPQQRPENKGAGNLRFLPDLVEAFRSVREIAQPAGMTVNADIQNKLLKGDLEERRVLLTSVPRMTLMMYEVSEPDDGDSAEQQAEKAARASQKYLEMAYDGLSGRNLAKMAIALRTPDYGDRLPQMLQRLDEANRENPNYLGWARHSYNDSLQPPH